VGPTADEVEGNSPSEELERENAGKVSRVPAEQLERIPTADNKDVPEAERLPGGASGDAAASKRAGGDQPGKGEDKEEAASTPAASKSGGGMARRAFSRLSKRKRIAIVTGALGGSGLLAGLGIFALIPYELVHIEENITHYFDKRLEHSIDQRLGAHFKNIFKEAGSEEGSENTGDPIADADHNFSMDEFKADADIKSVDYNATGEPVAFTEDDGSRLSIDDATLADASSPLMDRITSRFPPLDFFRLSIRSQKLDGTWGIVRSFLASSDEPVSDDPTVLKQQLDQEFTATEENTNGASETESADEDSAKSDVEGEVSTAETDASATIGPASTVLDVCGAEGISQSIHKHLWIIRVAQLMRVAVGTILDSGHQLKTGNLHASQLGVLVKLMSGFAKSGGWQVLTGDKSAKVSDSEQSKFAANPSGTLANVTSALDVTAPVCGPINSAGILGPIAVDVSELDPEEDGILAALETAIGSFVKNEIGGKVLSYMAGQATDAATKPILDAATATGADVVDATISGYDNYSNMNELTNGGAILTPSQVADLNQEATTQDLQAAQQKGIAYQLFSPNDESSLVSDLLLKIPTSPDDITSGFNSAIGVISAPFSESQLMAIGSFISDRTPEAQASGSPAPLPEDPSGWDVAQAGLPDSLFAAYPDPEANEQWIIKYLCSQPGESGDQPGLYDGDCSGTGNSSSELTDQNDAHHDPYHDYVRECFINPDANAVASDPNCQSTTHGTSSEPDLYDRFRVYRFDLGIANMNTSFNNTNDDQNPSGSATTTPTPAAPISGSAQQAAQALISNSNIGKSGRDVTTDLQDAANGQPGTAGVPVSQLLLSALASLAQSHSFDISAIESGGTGHCVTNGVSLPKSACPTDPHYQGDAADIDTYDGASLDGSNAASNKFQNDIAQFLPDGSRFGMAKYPVGSYGSVSIDSKTFHTFNDSPDHVHVDVLGVSGN
jgi:hypothetical protein